MYSGTTIHGKSGNMVGVHQRIDRLARQNITKLYGAKADFPGAKQILHFEGNRGPDAIKRKHPGVDEPWHFVDPTKPDDTYIYEAVNDHLHNLAEALRSSNPERAAFEAAWAAHAITDGLTPAHHYPLGDTIEQLWGAPKETRQSILQKNIIRGKGYRDSLIKNWQYWGAKGVFATHVLFELGVASAITTHRFLSAYPSPDEIETVMTHGYEQRLRADVAAVYEMGLYETFWKQGWTTPLAQQVPRELVPRIVTSVTLAWISAMPTEARQRP